MRRLKFLDVRELLSKPIIIEWLIEYLIEIKTIGAIVGATASGKSHVALSLILSAITKIPFANRKIHTNGTVVLLLLEGRKGALRRIKALQEFHKVEILPKQLFIPNVNFELDDDGYNALYEALVAHEKENGKIILIVIDTLAMIFPSNRDENNSKDMMYVMRKLEQIKERFGCTIIIIHHTGHKESASRRARGSSALKASLDFEIVIDGSKKLIEFTKMKDSDLPDPIAFEIVQVEESAIAVFGDEVSNYKRSELIKSEREAFEIFKSTSEELSKSELAVDEWRDAFKAKYPHKTDAAVRQAFSRAKKDLVSKGVLEVKDGIYSICDIKNKA